MHRAFVIFLSSGMHESSPCLGSIQTINWKFKCGETTRPTCGRQIIDDAVRLVLSQFVFLFSFVQCLGLHFLPDRLQFRLHEKERRSLEFDLERCDDWSDFTSTTQVQQRRSVTMNDSFRSEGPGAMVGSAVIGGFILAMIEGTGILINRYSHMLMPQPPMEGKQLSLFIVSFLRSLQKRPSPIKAEWSLECQRSSTHLLVSLPVDLATIPESVLLSLSLCCCSVFVLVIFLSSRSVLRTSTFAFSTSHIFVSCQRVI